MHKVVPYCVEGHCLAGETCPETSIEQRAYLDYVREDYGPSISADDDPYLIANLEKAKEPSETNPTGGCPVHEGVPLPENPLDPLDPLNPLDPSGGLTPPGESDPGGGNQGGGGTVPQQPPVTPPAVTPEPEPPVPAPNEPEEPGTAEPGGGLFDDLWGGAG